MPLEQSMSSREANPKSDVYSLGATVFKLLTGHVPFREMGGDANVIRAIWSKERIPAAREVDPSVPENVSDFVYEMTDPEHTKRPDASEARRAFREYRAVA